MSIASLTPSGVVRGDHLLLLDQDLKRLTSGELRELISNIGASLSVVASLDSSEWRTAFIDRSFMETRRNLQKTHGQPIGMKPHRW